MDTYEETPSRRPDRDASHSIGDELHGILAFIGLIWAVFFLSCVFPSIDSLGVSPRTLPGLAGIVMMPFLHFNLHHILSNTFPLFVLLMLLAGSRARSGQIVVDIVLLGGSLLWLFGRRGTDNIGASGLIFGLIAFLIVSGFLEWRPFPLLVSLIVGFLYGGTLLSGVLPQVNPHISWEGHLWGAIAGGIIAFRLTSEPGPEG